MGKKRVMLEAQPCPCGSGLAYGACCQPYHVHKAIAPTPEALMRSRYSAFALGLAPYLVETWAEEARPTLASLEEDSGLKWISLTVIASEFPKDETPPYTRGWVTFLAKARSSQGVIKHEERSYFECRDGHWVYVREDAL